MTCLDLQLDIIFTRCLQPTMERPQYIPEQLVIPPSLAEAAATYAANGWPVFPLHGKVPYKDTHGHKDATTDLEQIQSWWTMHPGANIGLPTGEASGVMVLDMDMPEGYYSLKTLVTGFGTLPETRRSKTANGGLHYFYQYPHDRNTYPGTIGLHTLIGLDVRAEGNYVVLPPSRLYGRKYYTWARPDLPIAQAPQWLLTLLSQAEEQKHLTPQDMRFACSAGEKWFGEAVARATEGNRNQVGFWLACQLRDDGISQEQALPIILAYANRVPQGTNPYTSKEALASVRSAYSRPPRERAKRP